MFSFVYIYSVYIFTFSIVVSCFEKCSTEVSWVTFVSVIPSLEQFFTCFLLYIYSVYIFTFSIVVSCFEKCSTEVSWVTFVGVIPSLEQFFTCFLFPYICLYSVYVYNKTVYCKFLFNFLNFPGIGEVACGVNFKIGIVVGADQSEKLELVMWQSLKN